MNTPRAVHDRDPETYAIIGAAFAVHNELGCGFLEGVYRAALPIEFRHRGIPFLHEVGLPIRYKGELLRLGYRVDFICFESVLVEVKALSAIGPIEEAQVIKLSARFTAQARARPQLRGAESAAPPPGVQSSQMNNPRHLRHLRIDISA